MRNLNNHYLQDMQFAHLIHMEQTCIKFSSIITNQPFFKLINLVFLVYDAFLNFPPKYFLIKFIFWLFTSIFRLINAFELKILILMGMIYHQIQELA